MSLSQRERARVYAVFSREVREIGLVREILRALQDALWSQRLAHVALEAEAEVQRDMSMRWCLVAAAVCAWPLGVAVGRFVIALAFGVGQ